ncbi:hypothetical protein C8F01DRAFT_1250340 [Mycena amicta]|nr:hypothetical protein C8F01DRAFT_1250340 [Mycena amicta]
MQTAPLSSSTGSSLDFSAFFSALPSTMLDGDMRLSIDSPPLPSTVDRYHFGFCNNLSSPGRSMPPAPPPTRASSPPLRALPPMSAPPSYPPPPPPTLRLPLADRASVSLGIFDADDDEWDAVDLDEDDERALLRPATDLYVGESFKLHLASPPLDASFTDLLHIPSHEADLTESDDPFAEETDAEVEFYLGEFMAGYILREPRFPTSPAFDGAEDELAGVLGSYEVNSEARCLQSKDEDSMDPNATEAAQVFDHKGSSSVKRRKTWQFADDSEGW